MVATVLTGSFDNAREDSATAFSSLLAEFAPASGARFYDQHCRMRNPGSR